MVNELTEYSMTEMERAGAYIAKSGLFGVKTLDQAMAIMLVAQMVAVSCEYGFGPLVGIWKLFFKLCSVRIS